MSASKFTFKISQKALQLITACSDILFFLPCYTFEALASKKKSKSRKEPKPAKPQGRILIHSSVHDDFCISAFPITYFQSRDSIILSFVN